MKVKNVRRILNILVIIGIILLVELYLNYSYDPSGNWMLISGTYYDTSKFYEEDTVAMLLNADRNVPRRQKWFCVSRNETHQLVTVTSPRDAFIPVRSCR